MWLNRLDPNNLVYFNGFVKVKLRTNLANELLSRFAEICLFLIVSLPLPLLLQAAEIRE